MVFGLRGMLCSRREAAMMAVLLVVVIGIISLPTIHAVSQPKASAEVGDDDLDAVEADDLLEGIVGEDDLPDDEEFGDDHYGGEYHYGDDEIDEEADAHWREEEEAFFKKYDKDGDGNLDLEEYKQLLYDEWHGDGELDAPPEGAEDDNDEVYRMQDHFHEEDRNKDGKISLEEWMAVAFHEDPQEADYEDGHPGDFENLSEEEMAEIRQEAEKEFQHSDTDGDGKLTLEEIINLVLQDIQEDEEHDIDKSELTEMAKSIFDEMDRNNDTIVDFEEFFQSHMMDPSEFDSGMDDMYYDEHDIDPEDDEHDMDPHMLPGGEDDFDVEQLADDDGLDDKIEQQTE